MLAVCLANSDAMKTLLPVVFLSLVAMANAQPRPNTLCSTGSGGQVTEGAYFDFTSNAPSGFRTSIHAIGYVLAPCLQCDADWTAFLFLAAQLAGALKV